MARFGFDVEPTFEDLPQGSINSRIPAGMYTKGVVMHLGVSGLRASTPDEPPRVRLHILKTDLGITHAELQYHSQHPYGMTDTASTILSWGRRLVRVAARYTLWPVDRGGLEMNVMLDANRQVERSSHYGSLRRTVAVACAQAVLEADSGGDNRSISLIVRNNFETMGTAYNDYVGAANLDELAQILDTNRRFPFPTQTS